MSCCIPDIVDQHHHLRIRMTGGGTGECVPTTEGGMAEGCLARLQNFLTSWVANGPESDDFWNREKCVFLHLLLDALQIQPCNPSELCRETFPRGPRIIVEDSPECITKLIMG
ncbi:hypothetical protein BDZ89DRAFT_601399 [Hymenopellis radicata]|nr:hypothetical protein BDZ89DRAFT_601399 [Hymenopellis radicata]